MNQCIQLECPQAILVGLHMNTENLAAYMKEQTAIKLFKDGKLSSSTAAAWLEMPRARFLILAMSQGAALLEKNQDDFARETALLYDRL